MPLLADRVQETTSTQGTGAVTLLGAVEGYRTFNSVFANGDVVFYTIDDTFGNWEVGYGAVSTGVLSRTTVLDSSNSNNLVNFPAGTKRVFCVAPKPALLPNQTGSSGKFLTTDGSNPSWATAASGGVNSVAIATNYGFKGTSTGSSSVTLSLQTNVTGILKGNASTGTVTAAAAGTDYAAPTAGTVSQLLANDGSGGFSNVTVSTGLSYNSTTKALTNASTATVSSVTFTGDGTVLSSTPSTAVTTSGTLTAALKTQTANTVLAGPVGGGAVAPTFRSLVAADIPSLPYAGTTTGQTILAGNNIGGFQNVSLSGLAYDTGTHVLSGAAPTSGQSILAGNNSGGFQNVTLSGLSYNTGTSTLSVTGGSSIVFNVKDYGAVGNNSNDDTSAIQAAIAAANVAGGIVFFPAGIYKISSALNCSVSGVSLQGVSQSNVAGHGSMISQTSLTSKIINITADFVDIDKLFFSYTSDASAGGIAIYCGGNSCTFTNFIVDHAYIGLKVDIKVSVFASQFQMTNCVYSGLDVEGSTTDYNGLAYVIFTDFIISAFNNGFSGGGIRLYGKVEGSQFVNGQTLAGQIGLYMGATNQSVGLIPAYNQLTNVVIDSATGAGSTANAYIAVAYETTFTGCWFSGGRVSGASTAGLYISHGHALRFTNCQFFNCGADGCQLSAASSHVSFNNCTFDVNSNTGTSGQYNGLAIATNTNYFQVIGCFAGGTAFNYGNKQGYGIYISGGCNNFIVANNDCTGNVTGGVYNGSGTSGTQIVSQNLG